MGCINKITNFVYIDSNVCVNNQMSEKNALYANVSINIFTKIKKFSLSEQFSSQFRCLLTASNFIQKDSIETVIPLEPLNSR